MPKEFQKLITIELPIPIRRKPNGVYEARFRKGGFNISVSSVDPGKLKDKFFAALLNCITQNIQSKTEKANEKRSTRTFLFEKVSIRWLELKRPTIKPKTADFYEGLFRANLFPAFAGRDIREIKQSDVQTVINRYIEEKPRTAVKAYQTLKAIFDFAIGEDLIERSPMRLLKPPKYEEKNGVALTVAEESELLRKISKSNCVIEVKHALLFLLYTGIRRSELASALIEDGFISVVCSKVRKGYRERRRVIPITPMLARWLPEMDLETIRTVRPDALTQAMKRLMPNHHLHELRHTFITRSQECGVPREVVSVWAGHAADNTQTSNVYTHFSREFMLKEGQKIKYTLH
ncbi:MAG: tyrosine-type recombinase/integrase [Candidatus Gallimonas sp.]